MTKTKAVKDAPLCSCGCGQKTRGGTFRMGHDQRLRGFLSRNEQLKPIASRFVASQPKSSEWRKLQVEGARREEERVEAQAKREAAKAERAAAKKAAKQQRRAKKVKRPRKARGTRAAVAEQREPVTPEPEEDEEQDESSEQ